MDAQLWNRHLKIKSSSPNKSQGTQTRNKIIIVGHPHSQYVAVEQIMLNFGMNSAQPALTEALTAQQISQQLCEAHGLPSAGVLYRGEIGKIQQLEINPIWYALVLDLVRGNLKQNFWGWADPSAVVLLNFWKSVFPDILFVLVYNHPSTALIDSRNEFENLGDEAISPGSLLESWRVYNDALLNFYLKNREKCLLVHAEQLRKSPTRVLNQLNNMTGRKLTISHDQRYENIVLEGLSTESRTTSKAPTNSIPTDSTTGIHSKYSESPEPVDLSLFAQQQGRNSQVSCDDSRKANPLELFLANELLNHYPAVKNLYEELQASAVIPLREKVNSEVGVNMVWNTYLEMQIANKTLLDENLFIQREMEYTHKELKDTSRHIVEKQSENRHLSMEVQNLRKDLANSSLEIQQLQNKISDLRDIQTKANTIRDKEISDFQSHIQKISLELSQKKKQLQQTKNAHQKDKQELEQENQLLLKRLFSVQGHFENYFLENQNMLVEIEALRKNQKPVFTGAKTRQQNALQYQIGYRMIQLSRSFGRWKLLFYPLFIHHLLKNYIYIEQQTDQWLPPLTEYQDYHEAIKAQSHLSYQLGTTWRQKSRHRVGKYLITSWALLWTFVKWKKEKNRKQLQAQF